MNTTILARSPPAGFFICPKLSNKQGEELMNDIFENTETMKENEHPRFYTAESVMRGHPDKLCDLIADSVLDACLQHDPASRVACEVMATHGHIIVAGEITTSAKPDVFNIVRDTLRDVGYDPKAYQIDCYIHDQSPDIAGAVEPELAEGEDDDTLDAGDQGVMVGYACNETPELMPLPIHLAHRLVERQADLRRDGRLPWLRPDAKSQVTIRYENGLPVAVDTVVLSTQHHADVSLETVREGVIEEIIKPIIPTHLIQGDIKYLVNPTGRFVIGGPQGDCGLTGRKIIVDTYGGAAPHGGGAFSGKDPSKVDRSAAYAGRYVAKNIVAAGLAEKCLVQVSYAIGVARPTSVMVNTYGTGKISDELITQLVNEHFDLRPKGIVKMLDLLRPIYSKTAAYGHFGREEPEFTWEATDKAALLRDAAGLK